MRMEVLTNRNVYQFDQHPLPNPVQPTPAMLPRTKMNSHLNSNPRSAEAGGKRTLGKTAFAQWLSSMVPYSIIIPCSCSTPGPPPVKAEGGSPRRASINGMNTKVTNKCRVKITLGHRVVYTLDVWVGNIGQCIDVFLGMNFMGAVGVRLCAHEGEVVLPDEERILLVGGPKRSHLGQTIDVSIHESLWLTPEDSKPSPRFYGQVGQSGGDRWVTLVVFNTKGVPVAARMVNITRRPVQVLPHTKVATLTDRDRLILGTNFVRPGSYQYNERKFFVYENPRSPAAEHHRGTEVQELERAAPPMVDRPTYPTPTLGHGPQSPCLVKRILGPQKPKPLRGTNPLRDLGPLGNLPGSHPKSTPIDAQIALARSFVMVVMAGESFDAEFTVNYHQGSDFVLLDMLKNQLEYLPNLSDLRPEANIEVAIVGGPGESDP
ncbi:hypothetical protein PHMEG_0008435 [Phytophthora megakarya]|uniref:Eukaryotic/viral aspartic protease n=1 Tax=Phytophthora megakarya TaxID=4795 RepID=A0A225WK25_9STRA|nr:hypothetical protein PHMEG_0008435 [Phytophthora megakarya]